MEKGKIMMKKNSQELFGDFKKYVLTSLERWRNRLVRKIVLLTASLLTRGFRKLIIFFRGMYINYKHTQTSAHIR